jgi:hypothetical protein
MPDRRFQQDRSLILILAILYIVLIPNTAYANPIDIFFWPRTVFSILKFLYANTAIRLLEGLLIATCFRTDFKSSIIVMILANCFSGAMGYVFVDFIDFMPANPLLFSTDTLNVSWSKWILLLLIYFAAAIVLEWPFCYWLVRFHNRRYRTASLACLLAQTASYVILIVFYNVINGR